MAMKPLKFYDVKAKKSFTTGNYRRIFKTNKRGQEWEFAIAESPHSDIQAYRILGRRRGKKK